MDVIERFRGSILGLAAGDALGHPTEFVSSVSAIKARWGGLVVDFQRAGRHPPGTFTDDTQMTIAVARALVRRGNAGLEAVMAVLGARRGGVAMLLFLALVAAGLPLLVGGRGGLTPFAGPTAGFLFSWPVAAFVIGWLTERFWTRLNFPLALAIIFLSSVVVMYGIGNAWLSAYADMSYLKATLAAGPFLPGDLLKAVLAALVAVTVKRSYPVIRARAAQTLGA